MHEVNRREDVLIPRFRRIGDTGWEAEAEVIVASYAEAYDDPLAPPETAAQLAQAEARFGVVPDGLRIFYTKYGAARLGETLLASAEWHWLKDTWAKGYEPRFSPEEQAVLPALVVFGDYLGNGNTWSYHVGTREVFYFDHDSRPHLVKLFDCVDDYLKALLISTQAEFAEGGDDHGWTEAILVDLFGQAVVRKWMY